MSQSMSEQDTVNNVIFSSTYRPRPPIVLEPGWTFIDDKSDKDTLDCLETIGDARVGYQFTKLFFELYPQATVKECRYVRNWVLSNQTFQMIGHQGGVDPAPVDVLDKGAGDAMEVLIAVLARHRPKAAAYFAADLFTPLIHAVMSRSRKEHVSTVCKLYPLTPTYRNTPTSTDEPQSEPTGKRQRRNPLSSTAAAVKKTKVKGKGKVKNKGKAEVVKIKPINPGGVTLDPPNYSIHIFIPTAAPACATDHSQPTVFSTTTFFSPSPPQSVFGIPNDSLFRM
ncbi:hypothetical protein B0H11DRAFT_2357605 [Mycena galericulata]|nr:hypothetical protein B0H11DRAFT_2357605 [Mycena galericulata]